MIILMKGRCEMSKETSKDVFRLKGFSLPAHHCSYKSDDRKTLANLRKAAGCPRGRSKCMEETLSELPSPFQGDKLRTNLYRMGSAVLLLLFYAPPTRTRGPDAR